MKSFALIIATFNRPKSLKRLLQSLQNSKYPERDDINLIVSCDYSGSDESIKIAEDFNWDYGHKKVITHSENLGLRNHMLFCGDLCKDYDGIVMLEDDLWEIGRAHV